MPCDLLMPERGHCPVCDEWFKERKRDMTSKEAREVSGRTESWLRNHECAWCGQTLLRALMHGCGAIYEKCEPAKKDFFDAARFKST